jgi:hypothetical protein
LEEYINGLNSGISYEELDTIFKNSFKKYFLLERNELTDNKVFKESKDFRLHKEQFFKKGDKGINIILNFIKKYFQHYDIIESEKEYNISWDNKINTIGYIDIKLVKDNIISIIDLKVTADGHNFWWVNWQEDIQSMIYDYLVYKDSGQYPESFAYLVYDRTLEMLYFKERTQIKQTNYLNEIIDNLYEFILKAVDDETYALSLSKSDEKQCMWCTFKNKCDNAYVNPLIKKSKKILKSGV